MQTSRIGLSVALFLAVSALLTAAPLTASTAADTTALRLSNPQAPDTTNATSTVETSVRVTNPSDVRRAETVVYEFNGEEVGRERVVLNAKDSTRVSFQHTLNDHPEGDYFATFRTETETISESVTVVDPTEDETMMNDSDMEQEPQLPQDGGNSNRINPQTAIAIIGGILALVTLYLVWVIVFSGP